MAHEVSVALLQLRLLPLELELKSASPAHHAGQLLGHAGQLLGQLLGHLNGLILSLQVLLGHLNDLIFSLQGLGLPAYMDLDPGRRIGPSNEGRHGR